MSKQTFIQIALSYMHTPYIWGGDDPIVGIDCSGFAQEMLAVVGLDLPGDQNADALYRHFKANGTLGVIDTGSLCFYGSEARITHIEMILEGQFSIGASGGGPHTTSKEIALQQNARVKVHPHNYRKDLVAVIRPKGLPF